MKELTTEAKVETLQQVLEFVDTELELADCPMSPQVQIDVAVEELFVNVAHYAYTPEIGEVTMQLEIKGDPGVFQMTFIDRGIPFDPLTHQDPDTTLSVDERPIGGLGIYMVKKTMDDMTYRRVGELNIVTIRKTLAEPEID